MRGESGWDIITELRLWPGETIIDKPGIGAVFATELDQILRRRGGKHRVVAGVAIQLEAAPA